MEKLINNLNKLKWRTTKSVQEKLCSSKYSDVRYLNFLNEIVTDEINHVDSLKDVLRIKVASFPAIKTIEEFNFNFQPTINENKIRDLCTLEFVDQHKNVIFIGNSGVGKTHLAIAIGIKSVYGRKSTYFIHYSKLMNELKKAKERNMLDERIKNFAKYKLLIIDEIGYLPLDKEIGNVFFQLVNIFYERKSLIITTNKPFDQWGELFNCDIIASAILDRLLHHSIIINITGKSYRTYQALLENDINTDENNNSMLETNE